MDNKSKKTSIVAIIVALVIGGAVGFGAGNASNSDTNSTKANPTSTTKASDLRANLVTLGVEHMTLTDSAVDAALDGAPNAKELDTELNTNGQDIGKAVGSVYGNKAEITFDQVWQLHLDQFVAYAVAGSKNDTTGKAAALASIEANYTKPLAAFLAKANPNIDQKALETDLRMHVDMTAKMIDAHNAKDYTGEANELKAANQDIAMLFSNLSAAIVKQYPAKF